MKRFFQVTLNDAVVLSYQAGSSHNHLCLDYIPGTTLLGALAAQFYSQQQNNDQAALAMELFHNGSVRFGPCYPVASSLLSLPVPASWYGIKGQPVVSQKDGQAELCTQHVSNQASADFRRDELLQYQQCRDGFVTPDGALADVKQLWFTKTAIDETTGKAKNSQLFNYAALEAGQVFIGWIDCSDQHWQQLAPMLQGQHRIGRSKGSEFGRISIMLLPEAVEPAPECAGRQLTLWCVSDLQVLDAQGQPSYTPKLNELLPDAGLPAVSLQPELSFVRTRQQSLFNQKRAGADSEQLFIQKGSVLVYRLEQPLSAQQLQQLSQGVGINQQQGLGWVRVNPSWAMQSTLTGTLDTLRIAPLAAVNAQADKAPATALIRWLHAKAGSNAVAGQNNEQALQLVRELVQGYLVARRYSGILHAQTYGPNRTQWQRVATLLKEQDSNWRDTTFGTGSGNKAHHIAKAENDPYGWGISWDNGERFISYASYCQAVFANKDDAAVLRALELLGRYDVSNYAALKKACEAFKIMLEVAHD